jgi:methionine synthase II (cobalamin-independent)
MEFEHAYQATGVGSLPHTDEQAAFRLVLENYPFIPFWPQLPNRSFLEGMVVQYSEGFPSLKWDERGQTVWIDTSRDFDREVVQFYQRLEEGDLESFRITETFSRGLRILEALSLPQNRKQISYVKGQVVGPITFGLSLSGPDQKPIFYEPTLRDILVKHLSAKARWLEKRFNDILPGTKTILFFDEPSLSSFGSAFSGLNREDVVSSLNDCFSAVKGLKGVHCCGNTDWGVLLETNLDILNFDAFGYLETLSLYPEKVKAFLERGGILAWGIVPTREEDLVKETVESLVDRFKKGNETLQKKGVDRVLLRRSILTTSCGTASLPVALAEKACRLTADVSRRLRESEPTT